MRRPCGRIQRSRPDFLFCRQCCEKIAEVSFKSKLFAGIAALLLLWCARIAWDYFDPGSVAHQAMQYQLKLFGSAMYEYHSESGRWPESPDDLAQTSLPQQSHVWRQTASTIVFLWPKDLKPDPKDNAGVLLAYQSKGLFNKLGRVWVCWGDLRTEHMRERDLSARLQK